ncbi:MAG: ribokinase [Chloroflexota bacterium]
MSVVVFGSINMDLVAQTPRLPAPGETIAGRTFFTVPGGKGANQAVAAARLDAPTKMVGRVGQDVFAATLRESLAAAGVDIAGVSETPGPSGVAVIAVDDAGENSIIVVPGANGAVGADDVARLERALDGARVLLLQLEVPLPAVLSAAQAARRRGVTVILDPAPAADLPAELYALADLITPNETEAAHLTGFAVRDLDAAERAAQELLARGVGMAVIKMGGRGILAADRSGSTHYPAFPVTPVDTVAAGDAFNGGVAAALSAGLPIDEALRWGCAAGAISVTRAGAQPSMPTRHELLALLQTRP